MINRSWITSQNELTPDLLQVFVHVRNLPGLILALLLHFLGKGFVVTVLICLGWFFVVFTLFPPSIRNKDEHVFYYADLVLSFLLKKIRLEKRYFLWMNS